MLISFSVRYLFRYLHEQQDKSPLACETIQKDDQRAIEDLLALLDEGLVDVDELKDKESITLRQVDLKIKSKRMLPLANRTIGQFFDLVSNDLKSLKYTRKSHSKRTKKA